MCTRNKRLLTTKELIVFAMLGTIMFVSKILMEALPNIHLVGMLTVTYTVVYRKKALIPLYLYVFLDGAFGGFGVWWLPYLYIWTLLWGAVMLLPRNLSKRAKCLVYPAVCCLHGLLFGFLYAPAQAILFGMSFKATLAWIAAGLPFDALHAAGNLASGLFIVPLAELLQRLRDGYAADR